jgi:hypothetical protein
MKDKILFWIDSDLSHFGLAKFLQEKFDSDLFAIYDIQDVTKDYFMIQKLVNFQKTWFLRDFLENKTKPDMLYLSEFEKKYGISIWEVVFTERAFATNQFYHFSDDEILSILENECRLFEKILEEVNPDYLFLHAFVGHQTYLFCKMCKVKNIEILMFTFTRIGFKSIITSHFDILDICDIPPEKSCIQKNLTTEELQNYLKKYDIATENKGVAISYDNRISKLQQLKQILKFILMNNNNYRKYYRNFGKTKIYMLKRQWNLFLKKKKRDKFLNKHCINELDHEPFVFFPLHVEPERVLFIGAPYYSNQLELITLIAKSLPIGYKLYVKEHPLMYQTEGHDVSFYKKIYELPNTFLLNTSIESKKIIEKCSLVTTINGTAGLEAAFYGKPTIIFSDTGYSFLDSVHKVQNLNDLPNIIRLALEQKIDLTAPNQFVDYMETNSFEFPYTVLEFDVAKTFYHGGYFGNVEISASKMESFLEEHRSEFELLTDEHIKKIKQPKKIE